MPMKKIDILYRKVIKSKLWCDRCGWRAFKIYYVEGTELPIKYDPKNVLLLCRRCFTKSNSIIKSEKEEFMSWLNSYKVANKLEYLKDKKNENIKDTHLFLIETLQRFKKEWETLNEQESD